MFKVNRQTDYAVRVVLALSKKPQGTRVSSASIGREMLIPPVLLQRIVAELAGGGFIQTQAGRDGGISLGHDPSEITLLQVVEHFEGELYLSDCVLKPGECPFESRCPVHCQWVRLKNLLRDEMSRITFSSLVEDATNIAATLGVSHASASRKPAPVSKDIELSYVD
jgi:Rrf2 family protein